MDIKRMLDVLHKAMERGDKLFHDSEQLPEDEDAVLITMPIDEPHIVIVDGSVEYVASCGHAVWLSPYSQYKVKHYPLLKVKCHRCALADLEKDLEDDTKRD